MTNKLIPYDIIIELITIFFYDKIIDMHNSHVARLLSLSSTSIFTTPPASQGEQSIHAGLNLGFAASKTGHVPKGQNTSRFQKKIIVDHSCPYDD